MRSPVERSMSSSRGFGRGRDVVGERDAAESVVLPIAETVPTTFRPRRLASTNRRATCRILSGSATDEPPNFITTVSKPRGMRSVARGLASLLGTSPRAGSGRSPRRDAGSRAGAPDRAPARARVTTSGRCPAQTSSSASGVSPSSGPPSRIFADASSRGRRSTEVAFSSFRVGGRASAQRPGRSFSVNASSAASFSSGSTTGVARPRTTTER